MGSTSSSNDAGTASRISESGAAARKPSRIPNTLPQGSRTAIVGSAPAYHFGVFRLSASTLTQTNRLLLATTRGAGKTSSSMTLQGGHQSALTSTSSGRRASWADLRPACRSSSHSTLRTGRRWHDGDGHGEQSDVQTGHRPRFQSRGDWFWMRRPPGAHCFTGSV